MASNSNNAQASQDAYKKYIDNLYKRKQEDAKLAKEGVDFSTRQRISNEKGGVNTEGGSNYSPTEQQVKTEQFVTAAKTAGFNPADIVNAAVTGKPLLPSQSKNVQDFVQQARAAGANQADIVNAITQGKPLYLSQKSNGQPQKTTASMLGIIDKGIAKQQPFIPSPITSVGQPSTPQQTSSVLAPDVRLPSQPIRLELGENKPADGVQGLVDELRMDLSEGNKSQFKSLGLVGVGFAQSILSTGDVAKGLIQNPKGTIEAIGTGLITAIKNPEVTIKSITDKPEEFVGGIAADLTLGLGATRAATFAKGTAFRIGAKVIPEAEVFAREVLTGSEKFPLSTSPQQTIAFADVSRLTPQGNVRLLSSMSEKFKGNEIGIGGSMSQAGLQDTGQFFSVYGKGSPAFLGVEGSSGYRLSLNPFAEVSNIFKTPQIELVEVGKVSTLPRGVISQPGFQSITSIKQEALLRGEAFVTKRSEIGLGTVQPQFFSPTISTPTPSPVRATIIREGNIKQLSRGDLLRPSDLIRESGTSEIEIVLPPGTIKTQVRPSDPLGFVKGFSEVTTYKGQVIPIVRKEITDVKLTATTTKAIPTLLDLESSTYRFVSGSSDTKPNRISITSLPSVPSASSLTFNSISVSLPTSRKSSSSILSSPASSSLRLSSPTSSTSLTSSAVSSTSRVSSPSSSSVSISNITSSPAPSISFASSMYSSSPVSSTSRSSYLSNLTSPVSFSYLPTVPSGKVDTRRRKVKGYVAQVRKGGVFRTISPILSEQEAFKVGAFTTTQSAARTFKIVQIGEAEEGRKAGVPVTSLSEFYRTKSIAGGFTQLPKFTIRTSAEKREIRPRKFRTF